MTNEYLTEGFSRDELKQIGQQKTVSDIQITAHGINQAPLPKVASVPQGFDKEEVRALAEGRMKGQVTFIPTVGDTRVNAVPVMGDPTRLIPIEAIESAQDGIRDLLKKGKFDGR